MPTELRQSARHESEGEAAADGWRKVRPQFLRTSGSSGGREGKVGTWSPHRLRHTFATEVRKSFGLEAVQVCLGHSQAAVSEIYAERDFAKAANVARQIG